MKKNQGNSVNKTSRRQTSHVNKNKELRKDSIKDDEKKRDIVQNKNFANIFNFNTPFKNMDLSAVDPLKYEREGLIFENCLFLDVDFSGVNISKLHGKNCDFLVCDFDKADITESIFEDCRFYDRKTTKGCSFRETNLRRVIFKDSDISNCNFQRAIMFQSELYNCKGQGADFKFANFTHIISRTQLMAQTTLRNCNFKYASFKGVYLKACDLSGSTFINTDFTNSVLDECDFSNTVIWSPILFQATIDKIDFRNADILGIELQKLAFSGVKICEWQQTNLLEEYGIIVFPDKG